ncbi:MAG TPA: isochorismatase family protein [Terriglobales bacterium]
MSSLQLDPKKTALIMIDLQQGIVSLPVAPYSPDQVVKNSVALARKLREKGGTIVYTRVNMSDVLRLPVDKTVRDPNAPLPPPSASELAPEAGFQPGDLLITKRSWGAFAKTPLEDELRKRGVDTIILTGIATNMGVESTLRQGTGLGFAFVTVEDACSSRQADWHRFSFENLFPFLSRVRSTADVLAALA